MRPEADLPVVPIFTNVLAPPVHDGRRFYDLGAAVADMVQGHPGDLRGVEPAAERALVDEIELPPGDPRPDPHMG